MGRERRYCAGRHGRDQGGSYGGYATLAGMTMTPTEFACGVDIVGPSNLVTLLSTIPPYWGPQKRLFQTRVGDDSTEDGRKLLTERSPLTYAHQIQRPLLIGQGANDPRVKQAESDQIVTAMQAKNIPVTYILYPDEGHGFARPQNNLSFQAAAEDPRDVPRRAQPVGDGAGRHDRAERPETVARGCRRHWRLRPRCAKNNNNNAGGTPPVRPCAGHFCLGASMLRFGLGRFLLGLTACVPLIGEGQGEPGVWTRLRLLEGPESFHDTDNVSAIYFESLNNGFIGTRGAGEVSALYLATATEITDFAFDEVTLTDLPGGLGDFAVAASSRTRAAWP